jgi:hypothetical protein
MAFFKRVISEKAKTKKSAVLIDWENGERKQRYLDLIHDVPPQESAYRKWLLTHPLERPWAQLTFLERAQWSEIYFDLKKGGLLWESDGDIDTNQSADTLCFTEYKTMFEETFVPEQEKAEKRQMVHDENGRFIGWWNPGTAKALEDKSKHTGSVMVSVKKEKQEAETIKKLGEFPLPIPIDPQLKDIKFCPKPQQTFNQFPSSYPAPQQRFTQQPIFLGNQLTNSWFERIIEAGWIPETPGEAGCTTCHSLIPGLSMLSALGTLTE